MNHRSASAFSNYYNAIRHLTREQCVTRIVRSLERIVTRLRGDGAHRSLLRKAKRCAAGTFLADEQLQQRLLHLAYWRIRTKPNAWNASQPEDWRFLNQPLNIGFPPRWNAPVVDQSASDSRLWHFHLHYFDWIWDFLQQGRNLLSVRVMENWLWRNRLGSKKCHRAAWSSYTVSLRIRNWAVAIALLKKRRKISPISLRVIEDGLWAQTIFLCDHLEKEHGGNHLLENLIALAFVARCFDGTGARNLRRRADRMLRAQLATQLTPSGCHEEQSPMYQTIILDRLIDLVGVLAPDDPAGKWIRDAASRMNRFLCHLLMPDGNFPLLGDSTRSASVKLWAMRARASKLLGERLTQPESGYSQRDGYHVFRNMKAGDYVLFDAAPLGVDSLGAHMHADILGFEVILGDVAIVADGGAGVYRAGPERTELRSAREHAGLVVDGWACAEPWKSFRMGRRGKVLQHKGREVADGFEAVASHDGFSPAGVIHTRRVSFDATAGIVTVRDRLDGKTTRRRVEVEMRIPLHHAVSARRTLENGWAILDKSSGKVAEIVVESMPSALRFGEEIGMYYPAFGISLKRTVLRVSCELASGSELVYTIRRAT